MLDDRLDTGSWGGGGTALKNIMKCVVCRKHRGATCGQRMARGKA